MMKQALFCTLTALMVVGCGGSVTDTPSAQTDTPSDAPSSQVSPSGSSADEMPADASTPADPDSSKSSDAGANEPVLDDTDVIPGEKFGPVSRTTTREDLAALVGGDRLSDEEFHIGEGFMEPATVVNLDDYSFTVIWEDNSRTVPLEIRNPGQAWQMPEAIHSGMSFADLQATLNDFQLFGLGWDYGGTVLLDNTALDAYKDNLVLRMQPEAGAAEAHTEDFQAVMGDRLYDSSNPHFQPLNLTLDEVIVFLDAANG